MPNTTMELIDECALGLIGRVNDEEIAKAKVIVKKIVDGLVGTDGFYLANLELLKTTTTKIYEGFQRMFAIKDDTDEAFAES